MAEIDQTIQKPASAMAKKKDDVIIHVMPNEFYGKPVTAPVVAKVIPKPLPPPKPVQKPVQIVKPAVPIPPKQKRSWIWIVFLLFVVLIAGSLATYFILQALESPDVVIDDNQVEEQVINEIEELLDPVPGIDADSDGLTDAEELIYMTDYRNPDTDGDTFLDGNEVFHRYDPLGYSPSTLLDTGAVEEFEFMYAEDVGFVIWYPKSWEVVQISNHQILFNAEKSESVSLTRVVFDENQDFESWYNSNVFKAGISSNLLPIMSKEGYVGWMSGDEFSIYIEAGGELYVMKYDLGNEDTIEYLQTFHMMMNSFNLKND